MKFSKIYITLIAMVLCVPIYIAYFAITGHFPTTSSGGFTDTAYITALKNSLLTATICASVSTILGSCIALFFSKLKDKFSVFFTNGSKYEIYIFNTIIFWILWLVIYINGHLPGVIALAHCLICVPLVFCMVYGFAGDMVLLSRCAAEIGSSPSQTFFKFVLPSVVPPIIAGFMSSFAVSFNDIIIAGFISRGTARTFTSKILEYLRSGVDVGGICTTMFIGTIAVGVISAILCINTKKSIIISQKR